MNRPRIAIIGSGISGLSVAHTLNGHADLTLYEAADYFGGHTHTVDITLPTPRGPVTHGVDTGFLVYNERTYPNLINLFAELGVDTVPTEMSFSVKVPGGRTDGAALEWSGTSLGSVFAQRDNLWNGRFLGMLRDLLRFNRLTTGIAERGADAEMAQPIGDFLNQHRFGAAFRDWYFLPMIGCIWSCPTDQMLRFPIATMIRFCHNHGLLQIANRPRWFTVTGGARHYVEKIVARVADKRLNTPVRLVERDEGGVRVVTDGQAERFDEVVFANHSGQALALLRAPTAAEHAALSAIRYQPNTAVLHTDAAVLPSKKTAWAAWNYERAASDDRESARVCLHYLLNKLQPLPFAQPVVVSLNPVQPIERSSVMGTFEYEHPVFDGAAIRAQREMADQQGLNRSWYCGAWLGYGFHEDGLKSGLAVARALLVKYAGGGAA